MVEPKNRLRNPASSADEQGMSANCERCDAPLETPLFSSCPSCEIEAMATTTRERLENEPWEYLPERWRRLSEGWEGFPEEFQDELRQFLVKRYEESSDESLGRARYDGRLAPRNFCRPDLPLDVFDDPVADEWVETDA